MDKVSSTYSAAKIDQLVATYAPIGVQKRRKQRLRRALVAGGVIALIGGGALLSVTGVPPLPSSDEQVVVENIVHQETLDRLARERAEFAARMAELEQQIEGVRTQRSVLEAQQATLAKQGEMLAKLLDNIATEQSNLEGRDHRGSQLDREIAAISSQRKALEKRWEQFEAQGELLAMEIIAVNAQRKELESQRQQIAQQRHELAELLERADQLYHRQSTRAIHREQKQQSDEAVEGIDTIARAGELPAMDSEGLDEMRGGFSIGKGLDVSFGYLQTGSVNGTEQFSNNFTIDSMASGVHDVDMSNMNAVVLQNGTGNFVSTSVLDSLASSFDNIIQNTLDDQVISTTTTYDIALRNVPGIVQGIAAEQALMDSVGMSR